MLDKFKFHSKTNSYQEEICGKSPNGFTYKQFIRVRNSKYKESVLESDKCLILKAKSKSKMG